MIRRTVREWDYLSVDETGGDKAVSRKTADRLIEVARNTRIGGEDGERILINGVRKLRAQQVVGVLAAEGITLEILPKIDGADDDAATRHSLVRMLAAVHDLTIASGAMADLSWQRHDLLEILIHLFCDKLFEVLHRGLPRRYVGHEEDLATLRGRLDVKRQFTVLAANPEKLACRFEELSADIALNRIMKAAVNRLASVSRSRENQRKLAELALAFIEISVIPLNSLPWHEVVLDRTNIAWHQLLAFAKLLLGERFQTTTSGDARGFSLLFEMNTLFEEFVGQMLKRALAGTGLHVDLQGPRSHALIECESGRNRFATKPDIVISRDGERQLVIDTKWKRLKGQIDDPKLGVGQSDVYQMMAYSHVYNCEHLLLLYPHHNELGADEGILALHNITGKPDSHLGIGTVTLTDPKSVGMRLRNLLFTPDGNRIL